MHASAEERGTMTAPAVQIGGKDEGQAVKCLEIGHCGVSRK